MAERLIIDIADGVDAREALERVADVIERGRVSDDGKGYCWLTVWSSSSKGTVKVSTRRNKASDKFSVWRDD